MRAHAVRRRTRASCAAPAPWVRCVGHGDVAHAHMSLRTLDGAHATEPPLDIGRPCWRLPSNRPRLTLPGRCGSLLCCWGRPTLPPAPHSDAREANPALGRRPPTKVQSRLAVRLVEQPTAAPPPGAPDAHGLSLDCPAMRNPLGCAGQVVGSAGNESAVIPPLPVGHVPPAILRVMLGARALCQ